MEDELRARMGARFIAARVETDNGNRGVALVAKNARGQASFGPISWDVPLRPKTAARRRAEEDDKRVFATASPLKQVLLELRETVGGRVLQAALVQGAEAVGMLRIGVMGMAGYAIGTGNLFGALEFANVRYTRPPPAAAREGFK